MTLPRQGRQGRFHRPWAHRASFRQLLLVAFLAIGLLLGAAAVRAVMILEQLMS